MPEASMLVSSRVFFWTSWKNVRMLPDPTSLRNPLSSSSSPSSSLGTAGAASYSGQWIFSLSRSLKTGIVDLLWKYDRLTGRLARLAPPATAVATSRPPTPRQRLIHRFVEICEYPLDLEEIVLRQVV